MEFISQGIIVYEIHIFLTVSRIEVNSFFLYVILTNIITLKCPLGLNTLEYTTNLRTSTFLEIDKASKSKAL